MRKPNKYWTLDRTVQEYKVISNQLGHAATRQELKKLCREDILNAIQRNGGVYNIRELSNYDSSDLRKPVGYWTKERTIQEYKSISDKLGHPARPADINKIGKGGLYASIVKNGGIRKIRNMAGYDNPTKRHGYWTLGRITREYKLISDKLGHAATHSELVKLKRCDICGGINKNGGLVKIRKLAGYDNPTRPSGYWTEEMVLKEYKNISNKLGYPVITSELKKLKRYDFLSAIHKKGGIRRIRRLVGYDNPTRPSGYWTEEKVVKEYKEVSDKLGHPATSQELENIGRVDLRGSIRRNGGIHKIRKLTGLDSPTRPKGYWTERNTIKEYKIVSKEIGHPPDATELKKLKRSDLLNGIIKQGGLVKIRAIAFGKPYKSKKQKLENLIGDYILR